MVGCGKHFPGLGRSGGGYALCDSRDPARLGQLWNEDMVPYRELHSKMPMIMTNHAAVSANAGKECSRERIPVLDCGDSEEEDWV